MLEKLTSEKRNPNSMDLDKLSSIEIIRLMNQENSEILTAIDKVLPQISKAIDLAVNCLNQGGRLIYIGAGTSGRLGVLDAVECWPTFGVGNDIVVGMIAGGEKAFLKAVEGAEDNKKLGGQDLREIELTNKDLVIGIAASGRTPYVIGALEYAKSICAKTVSVSCNANSLISNAANIAIECVVGPEIIAGSTRLKAGTAQKLILNMISTASMVGIGKVYQNLMVDVQLTNEKLHERAKRIVMEAADLDYPTAERLLKEANYKPKVAIVMALTKSDSSKANKLLNDSNGFVGKAIST